MKDIDFHTTVALSRSLKLVHVNCQFVVMPVVDKNYVREDSHIDFCTTIVNVTFRMKSLTPCSKVMAIFSIFSMKTRSPVAAPVELHFRFRLRQAYKIRQGYQAVLKNCKRR